MRNRNNKYFSPSSFEQILNNGESETSTKLKPILSKIKGLEARLAVLR